MKKILILIICIISVFILAGCQEAAPKEIPKENVVVCEEPYILSGSKCCLDENNNDICDDKEIQKVDTPIVPKVSSVKQKPEEIKNCNISYAISWAEAANTCQMSENSVMTKLTYTGKGTGIEGMWFYITTVSGEEVYLKDSSSLNKGEGRQYSLNIGEPVIKVVAVPMKIEDGKEKACLNQRMLVIGSGMCGS